MAPEIQPGDVSFVDTSCAQFDAPWIYMMNWAGRAIVKRLVPEMARSRLALASNNPAYPVEYVERDDVDDLKIAGRVAA